MPSASSTIPTGSDRECLEGWRAPGAENLRLLIERFGPFVYSSAYRRTGNAEQAGEVTRAVFLVLARRARKLRKKTVLAVGCSTSPRSPAASLRGRPEAPFGGFGSDES